MDLTRGRRTAVSKTLTAGVILVVAATAAVGYYSVGLALMAPSTTSSTSPSADSSRTLPFPFSLTVNSPPQVLIAPGRYTVAVSLTIKPSPSASSSNSVETIPLNATAVEGITATFSPSMSVQLRGNNPDYVTVVLQASQSTPLGNYTFNVQAGSGSDAQTGSFNIRVVQYLVLELEGKFQPNNLNVAAGGTVYWMDLDSVTGTDCYECQVCVEYGPHNVTFTTLAGANSPEMSGDSLYNYTFTKTGAYYYYSSLNTVYSMNGTITVTG